MVLRIHRRATGQELVETRTDAGGQVEGRATAVVHREDVLGEVVKTVKEMFLMALRWLLQGFRMGLGGIW